jgi:putative ABC transport system permease protein
MAVDPGFRPDGVLTMKLVLPYATYDSTRVRNVVRRIENDVRAMPGVQSVAVATHVPLDDTGESYSFTVRGQTYARSSDEPSTDVTHVGVDYFRTMAIPLVGGRAFNVGEDERSPKVYVVNQTFVKRFFPNESPIGKSIRLGWGSDPKGEYHEIVGIVGDVHAGALDQEPSPIVYALVTQYPQNGLTLVARAKEPTALAAPFRNLMREIDRDVPIYSVMTMDERVGASIGAQRFYASLIGVFAVVALALAAVGLYGVIAYAVSQRTHELGVRVALGATTDRISRMVISEGLVLTGIGVSLGIVGALLLGRVVSSLLFGVSSRDPLTLVGVVVALAAIAMVASWLPARRAARVDPLIAIRGD